MSRILIILLTLATAAIHFSFFLSDPSSETIYGLNGLGYVALVALLYLPLPQLAPLRQLVRRLLMGYAAVTIFAYLVFGLVTGEWTVPLGPITKLIEVILIGLLWREDRQPDT
jgi:hypothetical protein